MSKEQEEKKTTEDVQEEVSVDEKSTKDDMQEDVEVAEDVQDVATDKKQHKTLIALVILFAGVACGSLFIDVAQLFTQKGFSARALEDAQVVEYDGKTWVRYDDPKIVVEVFDADDCTECVTDEVLVRLRSLIPTLEAHRIDVRTAEGMAYAKENDVKHIPAFIFDNNVMESDFYQQAAILFSDNKNNKQYFDAPSVGVPIGEYLETPVAEGGIALDNHENAQHVVILYDNPLAKESATIYPIVEKVRAEQKEQMHTVIKIVADTEQKNSLAAARALYCAGQQQKYTEYVKVFYANHAAVIKSDAVTELLHGYATRSGLDVTQFDACVAENTTQEMLESTAREAAQYGVIYAPTFFIDGTPHIGVMTYQELKEQVAGDGTMQAAGNE